MASKVSMRDPRREQFSAFRQSLSARDRAEIYHPLKQTRSIRLLRLHPGAFEDVVSVTLVHTTLEEAENSYHALSYCWGDLNVTKKIQCNRKALKIPSNAVAFLRQLRDPKDEKLLWMDSICINQSDLKERQQQVKMMHLIFKHARHVNAWLGLEADDSALAFEYARTLDTARILKAWFEFYEATGNRNGKPASEMWLGDLRHVDQSRRERLVLAAFHVCQRPWVSRIWIQQEMVFGREISIHCGPQTITWDQFYCLLRSCTQHNGSLLPSFEGMDRILFTKVDSAIRAANSIQLQRWPSYQPGRHGPLFGLVRKTFDCWDCLASDPRDKIYAVLNLVPDLSTDVIAPDYSLPWSVVFTNFSRMLHRTVGTNLAVLYYAGSGLPSNQARTELPSWVIDWRHVDDTYWDHRRFHAGEVLERLNPLQPSFLMISAGRLPAPHNSATSVRRNRNTSADAEALITRALMMDKIVFLAGSSFEPRDLDDGSFRPQEIRPLVEAGLQHSRTLPHVYFNGDLTDEVYRRTITADLDHLRRPMTQEYCQQEWDVWEAYWRASPHDEEKPRFLRAIAYARFQKYYTFATTAKGCFCLVSNSSKLGDYVLIIPGSRMPVTIRGERASENEETELFSLVSMCYIHGMMNGQAGKMWDILDRCEGNMDRAAEVLRARWAAGEEGALHENYARVLSTITSRKILII